MIWNESEARANIKSALLRLGLAEQYEIRFDGTWPDGWWYLIDRTLRRQAIRRYRDPVLLADFIWQDNERAWPLPIAEV